MKRQYGLSIVIGKKTTLRFSQLSKSPIPITLNSILPANCSIMEPAFNTALTMKRADPLEAMDQFNDISCDFEEEFPIRVKVIIEGLSFQIEVLDPTVFSLINIAFNLDNLIIERFRASIKDILTITTNIALIKAASVDDYFLSELVGTTRSIWSNIRSYNCRRKRLKHPDISLIYVRSRRYLHNSNKQSNRKYYHKKFIHYFFKTFKYKIKHRISSLNDRFEYYYDALEEWEELYDFLEDDQILIWWDNLITFILLAEKYVIFEKEHFYNALTPIDLYVYESISKLLKENPSGLSFQLFESLRFASIDE